MPFYPQIKERKNVLLLGDSPGDAHMVDDNNADVVLRV
jgi:hypothetical protein